MGPGQNPSGKENAMTKPEPMHTTMTRTMHPKAMGRHTGGLVAAIEGDLIEAQRPHEFVEVTFHVDRCGCVTRQRRHSDRHDGVPHEVSQIVVERCQGTQCMVEWRSGLSGGGDVKPTCNPHAWRVPEPTDANLLCDTCGRTLSKKYDITPRIRTSIVSSVEARRPEVADRFKAFFGYGPLAV